MYSPLVDIDRFCRQTGMSPTRFGREAMGDPQFVFDLRRGRKCSDRIVARLDAFIAEREHGAVQCG